MGKPSERPVSEARATARPQRVDPGFSPGETARGSSRKTRNWRDHLTDWEELQVECLTAARAFIACRVDPVSKAFTRHLDAIRNRACQRARYFDGVRQVR